MDFKEKYRLVIATPSGSNNGWNPALDDEYLRNIVDLMYREVGPQNVKAFWLAGHSLGALFGSLVLFTKPGMFQNYILGSPSLWFDQHEILKLEQAYANDHRDLPARVMMYIGMYETINPQPRYYKTNDMIGDMRAFERTLKARRYPSLSIGSQVIADEDHFTVFPSLISRGLLWQWRDAQRRGRLVAETPAFLPLHVVPELAAPELPGGSAPPPSAGPPDPEDEPDERIEIVLSSADELERARGEVSGIGIGPPQVDERDRRITVPISGGAGDLMELLRRLDRAGVSVHDVGLRRPTLDDVFLQLTGRPAEEAAEGDEAELEPATGEAR